jgi:hypothetical protein
MFLTNNWKTISTIGDVRFESIQTLINFPAQVSPMIFLSLEKMSMINILSLLFIYTTFNLKL